MGQAVSIENGAKSKKATGKLFSINEESKTHAPPLYERNENRRNNWHFKNKTEECDDYWDGLEEEQ